jgi:hypothetical protein
MNNIKPERKYKALYVYAIQFLLPMHSLLLQVELQIEIEGSFLIRQHFILNLARNLFLHHGKLSLPNVVRCS